MRFAAWILPAVLLLAPLRAAADTLAPDEIARLEHGDTVARATTIDDGDRRYVGGVAYALVDATPETLEALLDDVSAYRYVLPRTKEARKVGASGGDTFVELHQGSSVFETSYTIRVRKDPAARTMRFWLDPSRPHGIDDAWGFFRWAPSGNGRLLVTFGALVDVGPGLVRMFFEERVRAAMLRVPDLVRGYVGRGGAFALFRDGGARP